MATIIFDFDGTLADSFEVIAKAFYELTNRSQHIDDKEIASLRGEPLLTILHRLQIPWWRAPFLLMKGRRAITKHMNEVKPYEDIVETIKLLYDSGYRLFIMSTNSAANVRHFLHTYNLDTYFVHIYGGVGLFGKARQLKVIIRHNRLKREQCVYIGDEGRDIEAAHDAGIHSIAATWGFSTVQLLEELRPSGLANKPSDIVTILRSLRLLQ